MFKDDEFEDGVSQLKNENSGVKFAVFAQRYDGVDLADSACRVLVLDGMPYGEGLCDKHDATLLTNAGGVRNKLIYRIEQGMGRAVRSHVDYAVVLLVGSDLANFIAKKEILASMNQDSRNQINLGLELSQLMARENDDDPVNVLLTTMKQCLERNEEWKRFYRVKIKDVPREELVPQDGVVNLANAERQAFDLAMSNNPVGAVDLLSMGINEWNGDERLKGILFQRLASYAYMYDETEAFEIQQTAYRLNSAMSKPPILVKRPLVQGVSDQAEQISSWFRQFENPNGAIAAIDDLRARLDYNKGYKVVEEALKELASLVGATGTGPEKEYNEGPDVLWQWPALSLIIEAKNQNELKLHKKDSGQLLISLQWFERSYPTLKNFVPVIASKVCSPDRYSDYPDNTRIITQKCMLKLLVCLEKFYVKLASEGPLFSNAKNISGILFNYKLTPAQFVSEYTVPLSKR
ncbi:MAG: hypothetical protein JRG71_10070 [Deltaproteobacteria bacterium]|nr:hypothetical protein [Deltaproteobacteria bacterium]